MKNLTKLFAVVLVLITTQHSKAQNQFHLGQYMIHQPFINPAAMGTYSKLTAAMFYRNQWTGFDGAPVTQGINLIHRLPDEKNFIGLTVGHDVIGINKSTEISGSYAYKLKSGPKSRLVFGLSASLNLVQSDLNNLNIIDQTDPIFSANSPTYALPNFKFGTYYYRPKFYVGFAMPNLLQNQVVATGGGQKGEASFNVDNLHYYLHSGYNWAYKPKLDFNFSTMLKQVSGAPLQIDLNVQALFNKKYGVGVSYRTSNELLGILTWQINQDLKLSYAYEFNMADIGYYSNGSHEIMLIYQYRPPVKPVISVPRF